MKKENLQVETFQQVSISNLPKQDYAKAKQLVKSLQVGQYVNVSVEDITQFKRYLELLSEKCFGWLCKISVNGNWYICKQRVEQPINPPKKRININPTTTVKITKPKKIWYEARNK